MTKKPRIRYNDGLDGRVDPYADLGGGSDPDPWASRKQEPKRTEDTSVNDGSLVLPSSAVERVAFENAGSERGASDDFLRDIGALPLSDIDRPMPEDTVSIDKPKSTCGDCGKVIPCGAHTQLVTRGKRKGQIKTIGH